jgi:hypothetical protein
MCKRIHPVWEIYFHFLVKLSISFMGEIERKETTSAMRVARREMRKGIFYLYLTKDNQIAPEKIIRDRAGK